MKWGQSVSGESYHLLRQDGTALCGKKPMLDGWAVITDHVLHRSLCKSCIRVYLSKGFKLNEIEEDELCLSI